MATETIWTIANASEAMVQSLDTLCRRDGGSLNTTMEPGGGFAVACVIDRGQPAAVSAAAQPSLRTVAVSDDDADAIARTCGAEVGHFARYGGATLTGAIEAVADTIINRAAHNKFPAEIQSVIDAPWAFTPATNAGGWRNLPKASPAVEAIAFDHLAGRANGKPSEVRGATHFLNPHHSSPGALAAWGDHVVRNAVAAYGDEAAQDIHYHGFPPGGAAPAAHAISYNGDSATFGGDGRAAAGAPPRADIRTAAIDLANQEADFFGNGAHKESDDTHFRRVGDYWRTLNLPYDGKTLIQKRNGDLYNPPWSAAFVSFIMRQAGAAFPGAQAHCHYFQHFVDAPGGAAFHSVPWPDARPEPGDIVHYGRSTAKQYEFAEARAIYAADSFYPSHADIVVEKNSDHLITIGGNLSNSVRRNTVALTSDGGLEPRRDNGDDYPWIGVLKMRA